MSTTTRRPQFYRPGLLARLVEGFRYGGGIGQWSWLLHRVTGIGILVYLVFHITDTFFVVVQPAWYDHTLAMYGGWVSGSYFWPLRWAFRLGEMGLFACVLFHAVNGVRIIAFDFWPSAVKHQRLIFRIVMAIFFAVIIPAAIWVLAPLATAPELRSESDSTVTTAIAPAE